MRKFKTRKKLNTRNIGIYIGLFLISIGFSIKYLYSHNLIKNGTLIDLLINDSINKDYSQVDFLLKYALNINLENNTLVNKEDDNENLPLVVPSKKELTPLVYIYNSHQEEKYESPYLGAYNIATNVLMASKMLKEYLEDEEIGAYVEEENITNMIHALNLKYKNSYEVSRMLLERRKEEIKTLKYFIDLHRDSSIYSKTTTKIDGESYAKILLVVGLEHDNYEINLAKATRIGEMITNYNQDLFRGISKKSGEGVNGIYNQDFDPNTVLIEVGGQYNNISEVNNTLKVLAKILKEFIKEEENE